MTVVQMRKKGSLTIPKELRSKYRLEEGDPLTLIDMGEGVFLSPKQSLLPKLVAQIEELREAQGLSLEELLDGLKEIRNTSSPESPDQQ